MRLFRILSIAAIIVSLPSMVLARPDDSVLLPGSKIVAGDLSKNEFFILAGNDTTQNKSILEDSEPARKPVQEVHVAEKEVPTKPLKTDARTIKLALAPSQAKISHKEKYQPLMTALNRNWQHSTTDKTVILQIKTALKRVHFVSKKSNTEMRVTLNKFTRHQANLSTINKGKKLKGVHGTFIAMKNSHRAIKTVSKKSCVASKKRIIKTKLVINKKPSLPLNKPSFAKSKGTWEREPYFIRHHFTISKTKNKKSGYEAERKRITKINLGLNKSRHKMV